MADIKNNLTATTNPGATDDASAGYSLGSGWTNQARGIAWLCLDATAGAAKWVRDTASADLWPAARYKWTDALLEMEQGPLATVDSFTYTPLMLSEKLTATGLALLVDTIATVAQGCRLGVYDTDWTNNKIGELKAGTGNMNVGSGAAGVRGQPWSAGGTVTFLPGLHWLAVQTQGHAGSSAVVKRMATSNGRFMLPSDLAPLLGGTPAWAPRCFVDGSRAFSSGLPPVAPAFGTGAGQLAPSYTATVPVAVIGRV